MGHGSDSRTCMEGRHTGSSARCRAYSIQTRKQQKYICLYFQSLCEKPVFLKALFPPRLLSLASPVYTGHNFLIFACACMCISVQKPDSDLCWHFYMLPTYMLSTHFFSIFETESYRNQEVSDFCSTVDACHCHMKQMRETWPIRFNPWKIYFQTRARSLQMFSLQSVLRCNSSARLRDTNHPAHSQHLSNPVFVLQS